MTFHPEISSTVSNKACQFTMTFSDNGYDNYTYYGQGGLIRGSNSSQTAACWREHIPQGSTFCIFCKIYRWSRWGERLDLHGVPSEQ
eukprot:scaffold34685_cov183-Amphora_coffeaeformis.AAC.40